MDLSKSMNVTVVEAAAEADTDVVTGAIDMQGYDGVMVVAKMAKANAGNYLKAGHDDAAGLGTIADIEGSKVVCTVNAQVLFIDIKKPVKRYVQVSFVRAGLASALGEVYIMKYGAIKQPIDNVKTGYVGKYLLEPASGTA